LGATNKICFFPLAAWPGRFPEEDFIKDSPVISNLKLRYTSYGYQELRNPGYGFTFRTWELNAYVVNDAICKWEGIDRLAKPKPQWEKTRAVDAGVELGLF